jgi:hypothetical protein
VAYSTLSELRRDPERLGLAFREAAWLVRAAVMPLPVAAWLFAPTFIDQFYPAEWAGLLTVVLALSVARSLAWVVGLNDTLYRALGRSDITVRIMAAALCIYVPVYLWAASISLTAFVIARIALGLLGSLSHAAVLPRVFPAAAGFWRRQDLWIALGLIVQIGAAFTLSQQAFAGPSLAIATALALLCVALYAACIAPGVRLSVRVLQQMLRDSPISTKPT